MYNSTRQAVYALKRRLPLSVDVYFPGVPSTDYATGAMTQSIVKVTVPKAILLADKIKRAGSYAKSFIEREANDFTNGQYYDLTTRQIIIDVKDTPAGNELNLDCWIVYNHMRYEIADITIHEALNAYVMTLKQLKGAPKYEIFDIFVREVIGFADRSDYRK